MSRNNKAGQRIESAACAEIIEKRTISQNVKKMLQNRKKIERIFHKILRCNLLLYVV